MGMIFQTVYKVLVVSMLSLLFFFTTQINSKLYENRIDFSGSSYIVGSPTLLGISAETKELSSTAKNTFSGNKVTVKKKQN